MVNKLCNIHDNTYEQHFTSGKGYMKWDNGDILNGYWKNNILIKGTYIWSCGDMYTGNFLNNDIHGSGIYTFNNGDMYNGIFNKGLFNGRGVLTSNNMTYKGMFKNDKKIGLFAVKNNIDDTYKLQYFFDDVRDRIKERSIKNGNYIGYFKNDKCIICTEPLNNNATILSCGHIYHFNCLHKWINKNNSCPLCRIKVI